MVEPLNTKAMDAAVSRLEELTAMKSIPSILTQSGREFLAEKAVVAYLSASPSLPVVDGGETAEKSEALAREYRPTMDKDIVHAWGADAAAALSEAATLITTQQQEIERLREALRPFADFSTADGEGFEDELFRIHDDHPLLSEGLGDDWHPVIYVKHFRAARAALKENGNG